MITMSTYTFHSLSDADFEDLVRDLLQESLKMRFQPFAKGRLRSEASRGVREGAPIGCTPTGLTTRSRIAIGFEAEELILKLHVAAHSTEAGWVATVGSWSERSRGFIVQGSSDFVPSGVRTCTRH